MIAELAMSQVAEAVGYSRPYPQTKLIRTPHPGLKIAGRIGGVFRLILPVGYSIPKRRGVGIDLLGHNPAVLVFTIDRIQGELPQKAVGMAGRDGKADVFVVTAEVYDTTFRNLSVVNRDIVRVVGIVLEVVDSCCYRGVIHPKDYFPYVAQRGCDIIQNAGGNLVICRNRQGAQAVRMISGVPDDPQAQERPESAMAHGADPH